MVPHFGLLDESQLNKRERMLMRSKLHWRCGMRRMLEKKSAAGIATLYDSILSAMRWYVLVYHANELGSQTEKKLENDKFIISLLQRSGVIDNIDMQFLNEITEKALKEEDVSAHHDEFVKQAKILLTKLHVLPFDDSKLPPEDPDTY
jgi:hypothetical protein